jgi:hypothetical protein
MAMVAYLPDDPRVHVVVGDRTSFLFYAIGACVWLRPADCCGIFHDSVAMNSRL